MPAKRADLDIFQGDQIVLAATLTLNGVAVDITSWTITARLGTQAAPSTIVGTVTKTTPASGEFEVEFPSADVEDLIPNQTYVYNVLADDGSDLIQTVGWGFVVVRDSLFF